MVNHFAVTKPLRAMVQRRENGMDTRADDAGAPPPGPGGLDAMARRPGAPAFEPVHPRKPPQTDPTAG